MTIESTSETMKRFRYIAGRIRSVEDAIKVESDSTPEYLQFWDMIRSELQNTRSVLIEQVRMYEIDQKSK